MPATTAFGVLPDGTAYFAPLGVLVSDGDRVCCHLCGRWFLSVASHLHRHGWTKAGYLQAFGLEHSNPLQGPTTCKRRAAALVARQVTEPGILEAQAAAVRRARSGELTRAAARAARGRAHPIERRGKTLAALACIDPINQARANRARGSAHVHHVAAAQVARLGFGTAREYFQARRTFGYSLAAMSRELGQHKDWVARHLDVFAADASAGSAVSAGSGVSA